MRRFLPEDYAAFRREHKRMWWRDFVQRVLFALITAMASIFLARWLRS